MLYFDASGDPVKTCIGSRIACRFATPWRSPAKGCRTLRRCLDARAPDDLRRASIIQLEHMSCVPAAVAPVGPA